VPIAQYHRADVLPVAQQVRWNGRFRSTALEGVGTREFRTEKDGCRAKSGYQNAQGCEFKKVVGLPVRREMARYLQQEYQVSERRSCKVLRIARSTQRRQAGHRHAELIKRLIELSEQHPRYGYRKVWKLLRNEGYVISRERTRLLRRQEGLQVRKKLKKQRRSGTSTGLPTKALFENHVWSYDFVADQTIDGKRLRCLTVIDEYSRQCMMIEVNRSLTAVDVKRVLTTLFEMYGQPAHIRSDNGAEFTAKTVTDWLNKDTTVKTLFIDPGSPWQNGFNESFNGIFRDGCLNRWRFESLREAREITDEWIHEYNYIRPHGSLNLMTPVEFIESHQDVIKQAA